MTSCVWDGTAWGPMGAWQSDHSRTCSILVALSQPALSHKLSADGANCPVLTLSIRSNKPKTQLRYLRVEPIMPQRNGNVRYQGAPGKGVSDSRAAQSDPAASVLSAGT